MYIYFWKGGGRSPACRSVLKSIFENNKQEAVHSLLLNPRPYSPNPVYTLNP